MHQPNINKNINKPKSQDQNYQFWNKKWGYRSIKFVESKTQQLQMKFIEKINSVKIQLHIASSLVEKQNNNKRDNILQIDHSQSQEINKKQQTEQTKQQQRLKNSTSSSSTFQTKSINQSQLKSNPLLTLFTKHLYSIQMLLQQIKQTQQTLSMQLLKNQTQIQQQLQYRQYLSQIQTKIQDMRYILINKQNEMAIEHLVGCNDPQLKTRVIKNYNNTYLEMCNIRDMCNKLCQLKRQLKYYCNKKVEEYKILSERNINQQKYAQITKSKQPINRIQDKQNKLQININHKHSHYTNNIENDTITPLSNQFSKQILQIFKNQLKRQAKLLGQNRKLEQKLNNLKQQHIKLNCRYRDFYMK